jgi:hypothetical protein
MLARVEICPDTWRPVGFGQALVGWDEPGPVAPPSLWVFEDWRRWAAPNPAAITGDALVGQQQHNPRHHAPQQRCVSAATVHYFIKECWEIARA